MDITVLDKSFTPIAILDDYISFIWTDRYTECGDFELYLPMDVSFLEYLRLDNYLTVKESDRVMIIENITIETNVEDGDKLVVTGRSMESILERRMIGTLGPLTFNNYRLDLFVRRVLALTMINISSESGATPYAPISNLSWVPPRDQHSLEALRNITIDVQLSRESSVYDAIQKVCEENQVGFRIMLNGSNLEFDLFVGDDRSYDQTENSYVVFSSGFGNVLSTNYLETNKDKKTYVLILGEEKENNAGIYTATYEPYGTGISGIDRRDICISASGVSRKKDDGTTISDSEYISLLRNYGKEKADKENRIKKVFEGEADATGQYVYGEDFLIGDIVQVEDDYGHTGKCYVSELIISDDDSGYSIYPTFKDIEDDITE